jgi:hypothetical protein
MRPRRAASMVSSASSLLLGAGRDGAAGEVLAMVPETKTRPPSTARE